LDPVHRPFTQVWPGAQQILSQQTVFGPHAVLPQHVSAAFGTQKAPLAAV
jgi:hypothetical protein